MKNQTLKELPEYAVKDIIKGINDIGKPDISINVSSKRLKPKDDFVFYFIVNMRTLIQDPAITKQDISVLMAYAEKMQYGNQISISQQDIAEDLGIVPPKVSKSVKKLVERGVFTKEKRSMYLNWRYLAKGNLSEFIKAERETQKAIAQQEAIAQKKISLNADEE